MNTVVLVGRLTADPQLKTTSSGTAVTRVILAVERPYSRSKEQNADFLSVVAWRKSAEFLCKHFRKGQRIGVSGCLRTGSYIDADGITRYTVDVYADRLEFVERKPESPKEAASESAESVLNSSGIPLPSEESLSDEDLPF